MLTPPELGARAPLTASQWQFPLRTEPGSLTLNTCLETSLAVGRTATRNGLVWSQASWAIFSNALPVGPGHPSESRR